MRLENLTDGARRDRGNGRRGSMEVARRGREMRLGCSRIGQFGLDLRRYRCSGRRRRPRGRCRLRRRCRRGARIAQIAFDHRQPIDDMAERVVHGLERILGLAVAFGLAETDIGQFALDEFGHAGILGRMAGPAAFGSAPRNWHAGLRDGAGCPASRPRRGRDGRRGDRWTPRGVRADRTRAARDGRRRRRCRWRRASDRCGRTAPAARLPAVRSFRRPAGRSRLSSDEARVAMRCSSTAKESRLSPVRASWSTLDESVCTSSLSRASASVEATLETMERSAAMALSSWWTVEGSSLARRMVSSLAPRLRIASS